MIDSNKIMIIWLTILITTPTAVLATGYISKLYLNYCWGSKSLVPWKAITFGLGTFILNILIFFTLGILTYSSLGCIK